MERPVQYFESSLVTPHEGSSAVSTPVWVPVAVGQLIDGRYEVRSVIAQGGMGVVCEATHAELGVAVAVKFIQRDLAEDAQVVQRFLNEARTAARLRSEHIARVYDAGRLESGEPYIVMERLDGAGLDERLKAEGPISVQEAVDLVLQACEGLAEAHAVGLVHRDIKPGNLFVTRRPDGSPLVKVLDFGIAKRLDDTRVAGLTDPRSSIGSPWYMSPEQMRDPSSVNQRSDIWALGVSLFELIAGRRPFEGKTVTEVCAKVLMEAAPPLREHLPAADARLEKIISKCLEQDPQNRYATATALAEDLALFASAPSSTLVPTVGGIEQRLPRPRAGVKVIAGALALAAGAVIGTFAEGLDKVPTAAQLAELGRSLHVAAPWVPVLIEGPEIETSLPNRWSAPPFVLAGAQGKRAVVRDGDGRPAVAAEPEPEAIPQLAGVVRYRLEPEPVPENATLELPASPYGDGDYIPPSP